MSLAVSEADEARAEVQAQLRYNTARGWVLCGFWLFVFVLRVLWQLPVAAEVLLGLGLWLGANCLYAALLRRCASLPELHVLALGYLVLELMLLSPPACIISAAWSGAERCSTSSLSAMRA